MVSFSCFSHYSRHSWYLFWVRRQLFIMRWALQIRLSLLPSWIHSTVWDGTEWRVSVFLCWALMSRNSTYLDLPIVYFLSPHLSMNWGGWWCFHRSGPLSSPIFITSNYLALTPEQVRLSGSEIDSENYKIDFQSYQLSHKLSSSLN